MPDRSIFNDFRSGGLSNSLSVMEQITSRGRGSIARFEQSMSDFFSEGEPLVKEVMLLLGRDPERLQRPDLRPGALELADRMSATGQDWGSDVLPRLRHMNPIGVESGVPR